MGGGAINQHLAVWHALKADRAQRDILLAAAQSNMSGAIPVRFMDDTLQDRLDQLRAQEGEADKTANVAPGKAVTLGQFLKRSGAAGGELLKPCAPPRNRRGSGHTGVAV